MYPGGEGEYASLPGSGFLRLHSTYRHDLKVYASDEGRVQMTAAAFTKVLYVGVWVCALSVWVSVCVCVYSCPLRNISCVLYILLSLSMCLCVCVQGLLDLEGSLASVRTHLVKRDQHATDLLDTSNGADDIIRR